MDNEFLSLSFQSQVHRPGLTSGYKRFPLRLQPDHRKGKETSVYNLSCGASGHRLLSLFLSCRLLTFIRTSRGVLWPLAASCLRPVKEGYAGMKEAHGSLLMVNSPSHGIFSSVVWLTFPLGPKAPRPQRRKEDSMLKEGE